MSQQQRRRAGASRDAEERYRSEVGKRGAPPPRGRSRRPLVWALAAIGVVLVAVVAIVAASALTGDSGGGSKAGEAPPAVSSAVANVPASVYDQVGSGLSQAAPERISAPALESGGKPQALYVGAEYCPYCAAERWALVLALERFGDFERLGATRSGEANIATFNFHDSRYTSPYLDFTAREIASNKIVDGRYKPLDRLTPKEEAIFRRYDPAGSIPFMDFGNRFVRTGATYDPSPLQGLTSDEIASTLDSPSDPIAQRIVGSSNVMSAALCDMTGGQPDDVCSSDAVKAGRAALSG
jgi:hypothetical protein